MTLWPIKRRDFIKMAGASTIAATFPGVALAKNNQFPSGFLWGAGSAAAQVESRQGRGQSNWDLFIDQGHRIKDGTSNVMNTDFQNRFMEDFRPLANAGLQSFRFSFAWPRIQPEQAGSINQKGIDTYDRIIDGMLQLGIQPMATMFHWDMPVWAGNLREREVAYHMADYAHVLTRHFGDRIPMWAILNEPGSVAFAGYMLGIHAPGLASADSTGAAIHHQNLAQGLMAQAAQANLNEHHILTTTISVAPIRPSVHHPVDPALIKKADDFWNRAFLDPMYGKGYPLSLMPMVSKYIQNNDLETIAFQPKTLGLNYYSRLYIQPSDKVPIGFIPDFDGAPASVPRTEEYFVEPDGLVEILNWAYQRYNQPAIYLTETGFATKETAGKTNGVQDPLREKYLKSYLHAAHDAIDQGVNLKGIYYWSASDNFEWAEGLSKKFGLLQIEDNSLNRIPKRSLDYFGQCAQANAIL